MSRAGARGAWTADRLACIQPTTLRRSSDGPWVGWRRDGSHLPGSSAGLRPGPQHLGHPQLAVWASAPLQGWWVRCSWLPSVLEGRCTGHLGLVPIQVQLQRCVHRRLQCHRGRSPFAPSQLIMDLCVPHFPNRACHGSRHLRLQRTNFHAIF